MKRIVLCVGVLGLMVAAMLPATLKLQARADLSPYSLEAQTRADEGAVRFTFYEWGGLSGDALRTSAVPWKLAEAALALRHAQGDADAAAQLSRAEIFLPFGFNVPETIANWPDTLAPPLIDGPLGVVRGTSGGFTLARVEIANTGCAACHSAPVYLPDGTPDLSQAWIGGSNASLNLDGYSTALFESFLAFGETDALMQVAQARFPEMGWRENASLRWLILPQLMTELQRRNATTGRLLPFSPSHIGATNGYDALRLQLGLIAQDEEIQTSYFTSIPALGGREWRSRFLTNGVYSFFGIDGAAPVVAQDITAARLRAQAQAVSYFTLPSMGVTAQVAIEQHTQAESVMAWISEFTPQPYPAEIDQALAQEGRAIYAAACAACHGGYDASLEQPHLVSFPNWEGDVGTETGPPLALTQEVVEAINSSEYAPYLVARPSVVRSAPPLNGLWASAPYLANGSVPTLWHFMRPETRPETFSIGGHRLDLDRVGIDLAPPSDFIPWAGSGLFDTRESGKSAAGHDAPFDRLSEAEKDALLEYLKLL